MIFNDEELAKDNEIHIDEEEINDNDKDSADELDELKINWMICIINIKLES